MAKGDYESAETLATRGRAIREFLGAFDALIEQWRNLSDVDGRILTAASTPLWAYYQPILRALVDAGGAATRTELEPRVEQLMTGTFLLADRVEMARGRERWQVMIRRARRALAAEGWIEDGASKVWRITDSGRKTAERELDAVRGIGKAIG
jgi:hypothetical protein